MAQHMPGPWKWTDNSWAISTVYDAKWNPVAECRINSDATEDNQDEFEAQKDANARLIAAAPELLEALKEARDYVRQDLKNIGPCEHDVGHCVCGILSMLRRMEEAISKAEAR